MKPILAVSCLLIVSATVTTAAPVSEHVLADVQRASRPVPVSYSGSQESLRVPVGLFAVVSDSSGGGQVLRRMDLNVPLSSQDWRVLCDGQQVNFSALPEAGIVGDDVDGRSRVLKFGIVPSPSGDGTSVLQFRAQPNNIHVGGAPRCEVITNRPGQALPRRLVFWSVFSVWIDDWSQQTDSMAITQWFHGMPGAELNPPFVVVVSGKRLWGDVRFSDRPSDALSKSDLEQSKVFEISDGSFYGRWLNFAIQAKLSPKAGDGGFMKVYLDGRLIGEYKGPIGYSVEGAHEYLRHGIYPLVKRKGFDIKKPVRLMYLRRSAVVSDPEMKLKAADLAAGVK